MPFTVQAPHIRCYPADTSPSSPPQSHPRHEKMCTKLYDRVQKRMYVCGGVEGG